VVELFLQKLTVNLTIEERSQLIAVTSSGGAGALVIRRAFILLAVDAGGPGLSDAAAAKALCCHPKTVAGIRRRFCEGGLDRALYRKRQSRPSRSPILDGEQQEHLIQLSKSAAPEGYNRWTQRLLADVFSVKVGIKVSPRTVGRVLGKLRAQRMSNG